VEPLEAGRFTIRARHGGREIAETITLAEQEFREIELVFR
jgi:hypothetical protein